MTTQLQLINIIINIIRSTEGTQLLLSYTTVKTFAATLKGSTHGQQQIPQKNIPL